MKSIKIFIILIIASAFIFGCFNQDVIKNNDIQKQDEVNENVQKNAFVKFIGIVNNEKFFKQDNANGTELWFNKWHFHDGSDSFSENFVIENKKYDSGLGYDGITIEGPDKRGYAFIEYKIVKGEYDEISGIFGFDDNTKIRPDSKLTILADSKVIFKSKPINDSVNSINIKVPINNDTKKIAFRFETEIKSGLIPKIIFADVKARNAY